MIEPITPQTEVQININFSQGHSLRANRLIMLPIKIKQVGTTIHADFNPKEVKQTLLLETVKALRDLADDLEGKVE